MGCHFLFQGIFPTQGWNLGLLHCRQTLYHLSHQGSPRKMQIQTTVRHHSTFTSMTIFKRQTTSARKDMGELESTYMADGNVKWCSHLGKKKCLAISQKVQHGVTFSSVQFSHSVVSDFLRSHESQHARPACPSPTPGVHSDSRPSNR